MRGLYWVTTADHDEDWFIVADSEDEAATLHEDYEGYDRGDAEADWICDLPVERQSEHAGWPSNELIEACGGKFLSRPADEHEPLREMVGSGGRVVEIEGDVYAEGDMVGNIVAAHSEQQN